MTVEERLSEIEATLKAIQQKPKDPWEKLSIVFSALIPFAIAYAGWHFSREMKVAEIESAEATAAARVQLEQVISDGQLSVAQVGSKVQQAGLVHQYLEELLSRDPARRKLALEAVLIALPEDGPRLARVVAQSEPQADVRAAASSALTQRRSQLIRQLYDESPTTRRNAAQALLSGWPSDPGLIEELVPYATENLTNLNGTYNALVVLAQMQQDTIIQRKQQILDFAKIAEPKGDRIAARVAILRDRLNR